MATRHKDRFICNTAESFVLSSAERAREKLGWETFESGTSSLSLSSLLLFFLAPLFPFSSCFSLSLSPPSVLTTILIQMHIHTCIQIHVYTWRSSNEKTDLLVVSARNAGQGLQKAAGACRGSVEGKGVQKGAKGEKEREESGSEVKKTIRSPQPSVEKKFRSGWNSFGISRNSHPFSELLFFSSTRLFGFLVERAQTIMILLDFITGYYRRCEVCIL